MAGSVGKTEASIDSVMRRKGNEKGKPRKAKVMVQMRRTPIEKM